MAIVEVTVVPLGTQDTSLSKYVAGCHNLLKEKKGIDYQLTPMGTIIEGDVDQIFDLVKKLHEVPFDKGVSRVTTSIKIDDRRDKESSMEQKIDSVNKKLKKDD